MEAESETAVFVAVVVVVVSRWPPEVEQEVSRTKMTRLSYSH